MQIELTGVQSAAIDPIHGEAVSYREVFLPFAQAAKLPQGNANVRDASPAKKPWKAMYATALANPQVFHLLNRGIIYRADKVQQNPAKKGSGEITVVIPDASTTSRYGVADGGHTLDVVRHVSAESQADGFAAAHPGWTEPYVRVRFMVGANLDRDLDAIVESLNTSTQVQSYTLEDYQGRFTDLKAAIKAAGWDANVSYRENAKADWDVREIVQRLTCFLASRWTDDPPTVAYKSRARSMELFNGEESHAEYKQLYKHVLVDCVTLPEFIQSEFSLGDSVARKKLEATPGVRALSKPWTRPGTPWTTAHKFDSAALVPLAAAFRQCLTLGEDGSYKWAVRPQDAFPFAAQELLDMYTKRAKSWGNMHALGTDTQYWTVAENIVRGAIGKATKAPPAVAMAAGVAVAAPAEAVAAPPQAVATMDAPPATNATTAPAKGKAKGKKAA